MPRYSPAKKEENKFACFACVFQRHLLKVIQMGKIEWHSLKIKTGDQEKAPKSWERTKEVKSLGSCSKSPEIAIYLKCNSW
uniref:Uncharacterized protein n=1 Tax=Solanum lycopersicum TaxID=4081 RepID=A0A3Q7GP31_SOLLC